MILESYQKLTKLIFKQADYAVSLFLFILSVIFAHAWIPNKQLSRRVSYIFINLDIGIA